MAMAVAYLIQRKLAAALSLVPSGVEAISVLTLNKAWTCSESWCACISHICSVYL